MQEPATGDHRPGTRRRWLLRALTTRDGALWRRVAVAVAGSAGLALAVLAVVAVALTTTGATATGTAGGSADTATVVDAGSVPGAPDPDQPPGAPVTAGLPPVSYPIPARVRSGGLDQVPAAAVAAYQRAAVILEAAAPGCRLSWRLLAAIADTTSGHSRTALRRLDRGGGRGPVLRDPDGTPTADTDRGRFDHDRRHDRALGPFALSPATWAVVAVDADDDGIRNPADLDDAALAAAVLLCDQTADLTKLGDIVTALGRLNQHPAFAPRVLATYIGYLADPDPIPALPGPGVLPVNQPPASTPTSGGHTDRRARARVSPSARATAKATKVVGVLLDPPRPTKSHGPRSEPTVTAEPSTEPTQSPTCHRDPEPDLEQTEDPSQEPTTAIPSEDPTVSAEPEDPCTEQSDPADPTTGPTDGDPSQASQEPSGSS